MATPENLRIPDCVLIPAVNEVCREVGHCGDFLTDADCDKIRELIGPKYAHISSEQLRKKAGNLRRAGKLEKVNGGHGPGKNRAAKKIVKRLRAEGYNGAAALVEKEFVKT